MDDDDNQPGPSASKKLRYDSPDRQLAIRGQQYNRRDSSYPVNVNRRIHSQSLTREYNESRRNSYVRNYNCGRGSLRNNYPVRKQKLGPKFIGFKTLEELAKSDESDIIMKLHAKKDAFFQVIGLPIERNDVFVLVLQIISKVCKSFFDELKLKLLLDFCNSQFVTNLLKYLMELPYVESKETNSLYWNNQLDFWKNFVTFCECIINISPSTALKKCRSLIEVVSKSCLAGLAERHSFTLPEEYGNIMTELREKLSTFDISCRSAAQGGNLSHNIKPPDDFRQLSLQPTPNDFFDHKPFLRPNIIEGGYQDVEHYLDVQFRLMREDCFGPLREGIKQYREDPNRGRYDNIRVHRNVRFLEPYISNTTFGSLVQLDVTSKRNRHFKMVNWAYNKRFIYGSLILFSNDNFQSFIVGTILDRDVNNLSIGRVSKLNV